ncbi:hypothetical protein [Nocardioides sp.]|uniref:hypothetical protein n=1 Tax=Nocardioides sp. TaxID=35761 RepID=UPI0035297058
MARRAIKVAEANAAPEAQAAAYWNASVYERAAGRLQAAVDLASRALTILENGNSTRNLAKLRTQLAHTLLNDPSAETQEIRDQLDLAGRELDWSSASPVDRARHSLVMARLQLREGNPTAALDSLQSIPVEVCHQDPGLTAEAHVTKVQALTVMSEPIDVDLEQAADLLTLLEPIWAWLSSGSASPRRPRSPAGPVRPLQPSGRQPCAWERRG